MSLDRFFIFYLVSIAFNRIKLFLKHWYPNSFIRFWNFLVQTLRSLDRTFAIKITARHWLEPLYQDRTVVGYILGFIFRTLRIAIAAVLYLAIFGVVMFAYIVWAVTPIFLIIRAFT
ncbi:MAG TPA: hypothetical protein PLX73_00585 [Candidatus Paceibacterota bacterium]|nr:hypothetical protein [Candidatus Paceibacterota bacterium]HOL53965.1 hypothetical protein [Candidatus Paceibacterota bacterium]HPP16874.1 hypothetical protein [Candidatus Paceibacterota bacterium]